MSLFAVIANLFRRAPAPVPATGPSVAAEKVAPVIPREISPASFSVQAVGDRTEADHLRAAMDAAGITDNDLRAGIAAIAMGESGGKAHSEVSYRHTSNARIREVFKSATAGLTDAQIDSLKADDRAFFNHVYGPDFPPGRQLGNTMPGDGWAFRGRGLIQITGRANYSRYGERIGKRDALLANPDFANDPAVSAALTVAYFQDRYKGGGWGMLVACVGNNTPDIRARKDAYYQQFRASGEFGAR